MVDHIIGTWEGKKEKKLQIRNKVKDGRSFGNALKRKEGRSLGNGESTILFLLQLYAKKRGSNKLRKIRRSSI